MKNVIDLARYLIPAPPVPSRFRRSMITLGSGDPTRAICSSLVAEAFQSVAYPILPDAMISSETAETTSVGMLVGKSGRTTQLRQGRVTAINVTVNVNYGSAGVAQFRDQIAIRGLSGDFSAGGDSGSLIWQWTTGVRPVGLLFAGGGGTTFGNRITRVLSALDIRLST